MNMNPERGGAEQLDPREISDGYEKWQLAGQEARAILLKEESGDWPPGKEKQRASRLHRRVAERSSDLAVMAAGSRGR
jgi:hypothetical protein